MKKGLPIYNKMTLQVIFSVLLTLLIYGLFLIFLLLHGYSFSSFILAGDQFTNTTAPIIVTKGLGYDGQFYYRLALDPFTGLQTDHYVTIDNPHYRQQRILYPLIAKLLAFGHTDAVPASLVITNLIGLGAIVASGALLAQRANRHTFWSLAFVLNYGVLISFTRDLTEITALAFSMAALVALPRYRLAALLLCLAVFSKETSLILAVSILAVAVWQRWNHWQFFLLPLLGYGIWQVILFSRWGLDSGISTNNIAFPLSGFISFSHDVFSTPGNGNQIFLLFIIVFSAACLLAFFRSSAPLYIRLAWLMESTLLFSLSRDVWVGPEAYMRAGLEWFMVGLILILSTRGWLKPWRFSCTEKFKRLWFSEERPTSES